MVHKEHVSEQLTVMIMIIINVTDERTTMQLV